MLTAYNPKAVYNWGFLIAHFCKNSFFFNIGLCICNVNLAPVSLSIRHFLSPTMIFKNEGISSRAKFVSTYFNCVILIKRSRSCLFGLNWLLHYDQRSTVQPSAQGDLVGRSPGGGISYIPSLSTYFL